MKRSVKAAITVLTAALLLFAALAFASSAEAPAFIDTKEGAWYQKALGYVVDHGLMAGTSASTFEPQKPFSRAMAALVSAKLAGADLDAYKDAGSSFDDVDPARWYAQAVAWANENGIAVGYNSSIFKPSAPVTREQLALMMMKLSDLLGLTNGDAMSVGLDGFTDAESVSAWATEAVEWAVSNAYISGYEDNTIRPRGNATRAQAAQIFFNLNYVKEFGHLPPDTSEADKLTIAESDTARILCWGDSLTEGCFYVPAEGDVGAYNFADTEHAYPTRLAEAVDVEVINYGISGETAEQIAERQGGLPVFADKMTIPADCTPVRVYLMLENEYDSDFIGAGLEPCSIQINIAGVWGEVKMVKHADDPHDVGLSFTRNEPGEEVTTTRMTQIVTAPMADRRSKDILVIFTGSNNRPNEAILPDVIELQEAMIDYADARDRYVVVDFTSKRMIPHIFRVNEMMLEHYGDRLVRFHNYLMTDALADAGITPTEADLYNISIGEVPDSLLCRDLLHGMPAFNQGLANLVRAKLAELGLIA